MSNREIYVQLRLSRLGKSELRYAVSLAKRMQATLVVVAPYRTDAERVRALVAEWAPEAGTFDQLHLLRDSVPRLSDASILVGACPQWPESARRQMHQLFPGDQESFCPPVELPKMLVPFGNGTSGLRAGRFAANFDQAIVGSKLTFYHTTWRNPVVSSDVPALHVCEGARVVQEELDERTRGIEHAFRIETADDVTEGIVRAALDESSDLIVMARGAHTVTGNYVDRVLARTTVPVLVVRDVKEVTP